MWQRLKNNKGATDLQMGIATLLFMIVVCVSLLMDFWYVSSAKIIIIQECQGAETFRLVDSVKEGGGLEDPLLTGGRPDLVDLTAYQRVAVNGARGEIKGRLDRIPYLKDYHINDIRGLSRPVGEMGITIDLDYSVRTFIRSPDQIFGWMQKDGGTDLTAKESINLKVTTKLVPYTFEN